MRVFVLTCNERRGAALVVLILGLGAVWDMYRLLAPASSRNAATVAVTDTRSEAPAVAESSSAVRRPQAGAIDDPKPVDLNTATPIELDALPGIGPVLAGRIAEHRTKHGPFRRVEELLAVRGIGPKAYERLRDRVRVGPSDPAPSPGAAPGAGGP